MSFDSSEKTPGNPPEIKVADRRFWAQGESTEVAPEPTPTVPSYVEQLQTQLAEKDREIARFADALRLQRDEQRQAMQRIERSNKQELLNLKVNAFAPLLEVADNLERLAQAAETQKAEAGAAVTSTLQGVAMVWSHFKQTLQQLGLEKIAVVGSRFDPNFCEAVAIEAAASADADQTVLKELRSGYRLEDRVIRPARVCVARFES